jgi:hypothetical protein
MTLGERQLIARRREIPIVVKGCSRGTTGTLPFRVFFGVATGKCTTKFVSNLVLRQDWQVAKVAHVLHVFGVLIATGSQPLSVERVALKSMDE